MSLAGNLLMSGGGHPGGANNSFGHKVFTGNMLSKLGLECVASGKLRQALKFFEQDLVIKRKIGNRKGECDTLGNLGNVYYDIGETGRAIELYSQCLAIARKIGDRPTESNVLSNLGNVFYALGELTMARAYYRQALMIRCEMSYCRLKAICNTV